MKSFLISSLLLPLVAAVALPERAAKVDYTGYKILRVNLASEAIAKKVEQLASHILTPGNKQVVDVVVPPESVPVLEDLGVTSTVLDDDLGASIAAEGETVETFAGMLS